MNKAIGLISGNITGLLRLFDGKIRFSKTKIADVFQQNINQYRKANIREAKYRKANITK